MPLGSGFAAAGWDQGGDFVQATALVTATQYTCNLGSKVAEEVGHRDEAAANNSRSDFCNTGRLLAKDVLWGKQTVTYVQSATGKRE